MAERTSSSFEKAKELAERIKNDLRAQLRLTCSIGVGPNKLVAKVAADSEKPDGLVVVEPEQAEGFLSPLPVGRLVGVGVKTKEKMQTLGINTVSDLAHYDMQKLIAAFGRTSAIYFHNASLGKSDESVAERGDAESISRIATLKQDSRDLSFVLEKTDQLCLGIHIAVMQGRLSFRNVGIVIVATDMSVHTRSKTLETATNELHTLRKAVKELVEKFLGDEEFKARRVGVKVSGFAKEQEYQKQLTSFIRPSRD